MIFGLELIAYIVFLFLALFGISYLIGLYNSLIQVKNNIKKAWSNIDVLLIERNEELFKLIDVAKSYALFEKDVFLSLTNLRTLYGSANKTDRKARIENEMGKRMKALQEVWENYPALQANGPFLQLQSRISELESALAERRVFFNETVKIYNDQQQQFPQMIFARMLGFKSHPYLKVSMESAGQ